MGAGAELGRVRLGVNDGAIAFEGFDGDVRPLADPVLENRRALRVAHARNIEQILDRYREPREQASLGGLLLHQRFRVCAGAVEAEDRQRIDMVVDLVDPLFQHVEQVERADLSAFELVDDCACGLPHQSLISQCRLHFVPRRDSGLCSAVEHLLIPWQRDEL